MKEIIIDGLRMMQVCEHPTILISLKSKPDFSTFNISEKEKLLKKNFNIVSYSDFQQSHGDAIFGVDGISDSFDGFYTNKKNHAYGIKTADCIPLILWNSEKIILFGLHCGWRGLLSGIVEKMHNGYLKITNVDPKQMRAVESFYLLVDKKRIIVTVFSFQVTLGNISTLMVVFLVSRFATLAIDDLL